MKVCGCGKVLCAKNSSGRCRACHLNHMNTDPGIRERALAGMRSEEGRAARENGRREWIKRRTPEQLARASAHGKRMHAAHLTRPEVVSANLSPEVRSKAGMAASITRLPWCPPDLIPLYRYLTAKKRMRAAEARQAMADMIPGTPEYARRSVANALDAQRIRHERDIAQSY